MPSTLPEGDPAPPDGRLPAASLAGLGGQPFGIYLHVPFCTTRCGYCDFNTYTAAELGAAPGTSQDAYLDAALAEVELAGRVLDDSRSLSPDLRVLSPDSRALSPDLRALSPDLRALSLSKGSGAMGPSTSSGHVDGGSGHVDGGSGHVDGGSGHVDGGSGHIDGGSGHIDGGIPQVDTVFVGGGTPTLLAPDRLARLLDRIRSVFGLAPEAEVTTEANPESVDAASIARLREAGFTRLSFGMQSAVPHVLATLDRVHSPGRPQQCVTEARAAGFEHVSLDLIYGTPGESAADWSASLDAALAAGPDHVSAYSLIVEPGTRLAMRIRRGELPMPDDDDLADKYLAAEDRLVGAGFGAYEVSNWATSTAARCRHNEGYWRSADWWGIGPGAHSHVGGTRWWNVKHPRAYAERLAAGVSPAQAREVLGRDDRRVERVLLELRLADGLDPSVLTDSERGRVPELVDRGLLEPEAGPLRLTLTGRLLADGVIRDLLD